MNTRLLIVCSETIPSNAGDGRNAFLLAKTLAAKGYGVTLLAYRYNHQHKGFDNVDGVKIVRARYLAASQLGRFISRVLLLISALRYGAGQRRWLLFGAFPGFLWIWVLGIVMGRSIIFRSTLVGFDDFPSLQGRSSTCKAILRMATNRLAGYYALNSAFEKSFRLDFPSTPIFCSPQGVDISLFGGKEELLEALRLTHGIPHDTFVFIMVGHMIERKGFPEIAQWLASVSKPFVLLHVGNHGAAKAEGVDFHAERISAVTREVKDILGDRCILVEPTAAIASYYAAAHAFIMASYAEGFPPNTLNEAMASGLPVICRRIAGADDYLENNQNAILFSTRDEFLAGVETLMTDAELKKRLSVQSREFACARLSIDTISSSLMRFWEEVDVNGR